MIFSSRNKRWPVVALLLASLGLGGCPQSVDFGDFQQAPPPVDGGDNGGGDPGGAVTESTSFDPATLGAAPDGSFTLGTPPVTASFSGGTAQTVSNPDLARSGGTAWLIAEGDTGVVSFGSPASEVGLWFRQELESGAVTAKTQGVSQRKTECGLSDQGNDNAEAFGQAMFMRGGFNDWGNPSPEAPYNFINFGDNVYQAEFELVAGTYEYKMADAGWSLEYANADAATVVGTAIVLTGGAAAGAPNGSLEITEDGCYNFTAVADTSELPAPAAELTVTKITLDDDDGGGGGPASGASVVRVYDTDDVQIASIDGTTSFQEVSLTRADGQTLIGRIEVENIVGTAARSAGLSKAECGLADQGNDNGEAFGQEMFMRGGFNDWGNPSPVAPYNFINFGDNVYQAEFELVAGTYEYKMADAGWSLEYANADAATVVGTAIVLTGGAAAGAPNGSLEITEDGCYNFTAVADTSELPAPAAELTVTKVTLDDDDGGGGGGGGIGLVAVDDFTFTATPVEIGPVTVQIFYHRADGDYSATTIDVTGDLTGGDTTLTCAPDPGGFGCVVTVEVTDGGSLTYTVFNGGVADPAGAITVDTDDLDADAVVYTFSGSSQPLLAMPGGLPAADEVILYYKRSDDSYTGWGLHLFPTGSPDWTQFATPGEYLPEGVDPLLGAYFRIGLPQNVSPAYSASPGPLDTFPAELGFIIHRGDEKDPGPDQFIRIAQDGNIVFVTSGVNLVAGAPPVPGAVTINGRAAHWVTADTLLWNAGTNVSSVELHHSSDASIGVTGTSVSGADDVFALTPGTNPQPENQQHLASYAAYTLPAAASDAAASLLRGQLVAVGKNSSGVAVAATLVQAPGVLDDLYAENAVQANLGVVFEAGVPTISVWAPTAKQDPGVTLNLYNPDGSTAGTEAMSYDADSGVWSVTGNAGWDRMYYTFTLQVYSYAVDDIVTNEVTDPYSVSLAANSSRSQIVDLDDADLKPAGWDELAKPALEAPEDIVLYELHIRDFSATDETVDPANVGKYTAFASTPTRGAIVSDGIRHLGALSDAGLTHVHILPSFDIATVEEIRDNRIEIDDLVDDLCAVNSAAAAALCPANNGMTIRQVLEAETAADPKSELQQEIATNWLSNLDGFNWGYDPFHYTVPEGSYASDPDGTARIVEFRQMVAGLADINLRTVMDVVYNHTNEGGQGARSVLDRVVPGYYHRYNETSGAIENSTCCSNTASEFAMMEKLMIDSLVTWATQYKVDGFRFDLMGFHTLENMQNVLATLRALTPENDGVDGSSIYVYGEGWDFGEVGGNRRFFQATQPNTAGTGIATFTDRIRDAIRGGGPFDSGVNHVRNQGFMSGGSYDPNALNADLPASFVDEALLSADQIRAGMAGSIAGFTFEDRTGATVTGADVPYGGSATAYVSDPEEIINYTAAHDNETLWDIGQYKHPADTPVAERVRAQNIATDVVLLSQGVPFLHAGQDMLRSKATDRDSFNSGDWFNELDFSYQGNHFKVGLPGREKNQNNYPEVEEIFDNPNNEVTGADIEFAVAHAREMIRVRKSSPLFRLRSAEQISAALSFHNTGPDQEPGVIIMRLDDGAACSAGDLDPTYDAVVAYINASNTEQTSALFTDETFALHPTLAASVDAVVQGASHDATNGFTVPARTTAVFVQQQTADCGPYGVDVFVRGVNGDWGTTNKLFYDQGTTSFTTTIALTADAQSFKIASEDWATVDFGGDGIDNNVSLGTPYNLMTGIDNNNLELAVAGAGDHEFVVDVTDPVNPVLTVDVPAAPCGLMDQGNDNAAAFGQEMFMRGAFNDWGNPSPTPPHNFINFGGGVYQAEFELVAGSYPYKVADAGWSLEYSNSSQSTEVGVPIDLPGGVPSGAPNSTLVVPQDGCYNFSMIAVGGGVPPPSAELTVTQQ